MLLYTYKTQMWSDLVLQRVTTAEVVWQGRTQSIHICTYVHTNTHTCTLLQAYDREVLGDTSMISYVPRCGGINKCV